MTAAAEIYAEAWAEGWRPEPSLTLSEWADANRVLSGVSSSEPGPWRTSRVPYLSEIMDCLSPSSPVRRVIVMKGAQVGFTEAGNNWLGFILDHAPGPTLVVQPNLDTMKKFSRQRFDPMIRSTPRLAGKIAAVKSRDPGNTVSEKSFPGGFLAIVTANSAASLRSLPIRYLFADEVDAYPGDVGDEGDPIKLAEQRTATYRRAKKILIGSTPTMKGISRIEREFDLTDKRRYFVPCPHCGAFDWIRWENIRFEEDRPETARLMCIHCERLIDERHKTQMLAEGSWEATAEGKDPFARGYHLSALYSPLGWRSWSECAADFQEGHRDQLRHKVWINTTLGETYEERGTSVEPEGLLARRETYPAEVPNGVGVLVAAVDVQDNRLEVQVKGYGAGEESWLIAYEQIPGDPGQLKVWGQLDGFLRQSWRHESGQDLRIERTVVDSGGHHTDDVYRYCKARQGRDVYAIRGGNSEGKEIITRPSTKNRYRLLLFTICTDTAKDKIYSRLKIPPPAAGERTPGYLHFPGWIDEEYCDGLTAEKAFRKWDRRRGSVRVWKKIRERNEPLDLEVYCLAALNMMGQAFIRSLPERAARFAVPVDPASGRPKNEPPDTPAPDSPRRRLPRRGGWVDRWRR